MIWCRFFSAANTARAPPLSGAAALVESSKEDIDELDLGGVQDDLRNYAYEGECSEAGSLSTINSGKHCEVKKRGLQLGG